MSEAFDLSTLFFLAIAVIIFLRLRGVLGKRTGNERRPYDPYTSNDPAQPGAENDNKDGNVISMPGVPKIDDQVEPSPYDADEPEEFIWKGFAEPGSPLAENLDRVADLDRTFNPHEFLGGAKSAYELIVTAFADGDRKILKNLLSKDVFSGFDAAISARQKAGETIESSFVGIDRATILDAAAKGRTVSLTVKFVSELISATRDADGKVIDGDPKKVREVVDIWTFMRDTSTRDPNWQLVATETAN